MEDTGDGGVSEGAESPSWPCVYPFAPRNCWAPRPRPVPRASRRPEEDPCQVSSLAPAKQPATRSPASLSRVLPRSGANVRLRNRSSFAVHGRRRNAAHKQFPRSPLRGLLPVCGPQEAGRGEAPRCHGDALRLGEGLPNDNDRFEVWLGLKPFSWIAQCSVSA